MNLSLVVITIPFVQQTHKLPLQLFTAGMLLLQNSQLTTLDFFDDVNKVYGVEHDGPISIEDAITTVKVPEFTFFLIKTCKLSN